MAHRIRDIENADAYPLREPIRDHTLGWDARRMYRNPYMREYRIWVSVMTKAFNACLGKDMKTLERLLNREVDKLGRKYPKVRAFKGRYGGVGACRTFKELMHISTAVAHRGKYWRYVSVKYVELTQECRFYECDPPRYCDVSTVRPYMEWEEMLIPDDGKVHLLSHKDLGPAERDGIAYHRHLFPHIHVYFRGQRTLWYWDEDGLLRKTRDVSARMNPRYYESSIKTVYILNEVPLPDTAVNGLRFIPDPSKDLYPLSERMERYKAMLKDEMEQWRRDIIEEEIIKLKRKIETIIKKNRNGYKKRLL